MPGSMELYRLSMGSAINIEGNKGGGTWLMPKPPVVEKLEPEAIDLPPEEKEFILQWNYIHPSELARSVARTIWRGAMSNEAHVRAAIRVLARYAEFDVVQITNVRRTEGKGGPVEQWEKEALSRRAWLIRRGGLEDLGPEVSIEMGDILKFVLDGFPVQPEQLVFCAS